MRIRCAILAVTAGLVLVLPARAATLDVIAPMDGPIVWHFDAPPDPFAAGHRGIDFAAPVGTEVVAAADGIVAFAGQVGGRLFVSIDHPVGLRTTYSFLSAVLVTRGDGVAQGDLVARSGTGHGSAAAPQEPHLHFGLRDGDEYLDPEPYLLASIRRNVWRVVRLAPDAS